MAKRTEELVDSIAEVAEQQNITSSDPGVRGPVHLSEVRKKRRQARRVEAVSLRLAGMSYEQIAERLDISVQGARDLVARTLSRAENRAVDELRDIEGARLDRAQAAIWTQVLEGDTKAIDTFLRISQRRAKLFGLDAATKIDLSMTVRDEMVSALNELERMVLGEVIESEVVTGGHRGSERSIESAEERGRESAD